MRAMRKTVRSHDVVTWADQFVGRLSEVRAPHGRRVRPSEGRDDPEPEATRG